MPRLQDQSMLPPLAWSRGEQKDLGQYFTQLVLSQLTNVCMVLQKNCCFMVCCVQSHCQTVEGTGFTEINPNLLLYYLYPCIKHFILQLVQTMYIQKAKDLFTTTHVFNTLQGLLNRFTITGSKSPEKCWKHSDLRASESLKNDQNAVRSRFVSNTTMCL